LPSGTLVTLTGTGFLLEYTPVCQFGALPPVAATVLYSSRLLSEAPAALATGSVALALSNNNGADFTATTFQAVVHLLSADVIAGPSVRSPRAGRVEWLHLSAHHTPPPVSLWRLGGGTS